MKEFFENIKNEKKFIFDDQPIIFKNVVEDYYKYCSWKEIEQVLNRWNCLDVFELVDSNGRKMNMPWIPTSWAETLDKKFVIDSFNQGCSLVVKRWEQFNDYVQTFCKNLDNTFEVSSSAHVYSGLRNSKSFDVHCDNPPNFILQVYGKTNWIVYKNKLSNLYSTRMFNKKVQELEIDFETTLFPGDIIYIPSKIYHLAEPQENRISISFPCWPMVNVSSNKDYNYYKLKVDN